MKLIHEIDGQLLHLFKFWSVRWSAVAAACSATATVYEGFKQIDPPSVRGIPEWVITALIVGAMVFTLASMLARGMHQPKLSTTPPDSEDHQ